MEIPDNVIGRLSLCGLLIIGFTAQLSATSVTADSNSYWYNKTSSTPGTATWTGPKVPTFSDTIKWNSGPNYTDGSPAPWSHTQSVEQKFSYNPHPPILPIGRTLTGFSYVDGPTGGTKPPVCVPALGSCALTSGSGSSTAAPPSYTATWTVSASGILGTAATPEYISTASGDDPWTVSAADLAGLSGGYSMFFTAGLDGAMFSPNGSVGLEVDYSTAAGSIDLLQVLLDPSGAHLSSSPSAAALGLTIFLVPSPGTDPNTFSGAALTLSEIQNLLQLGLSGNNLSGPIELGFLLNNLPIPTVDMGNGVLAQVDVTATANDHAQGSAAPEPGTLSLFGCGVAFVGISRFLRRKFKATILV
jgi:hypothetical protein